MELMMIFSSIVGSFLKNKGVDVYLKAVNNINCNKCVFELVGREGSDKKYNELIKTLITDKVIFKGFIDDIKNYYNSIDVVIHTSIEADALPTVLIEGLAKGKILIGSDVGGVREIIDTGYGNIIVPPNDVQALKKAILEVSKYDNNKISFIKEKNIQRAKEIFKLEKQIKRITEIYYEVLNV
ncbi:hypothetical protein C3L23_08550 [Nautilia sp. PV-1]|uniref:glycosyltransferase family 4 protein n=1 Tax=Nautilia sp. PV-1 TaxID=2579250 RepID=UPI000FDB9361|nr:hypothetical protein C3L23_08550 [Nautilia sp. PV-1]